MRHWLLGLSAMALVSSPAAAEQFVAIGAGTQSCSQFAAAYKAAPSENETVYFAWAEGYLSYMNMELFNLGLAWRDLNSMDIAAQQHIIRDYCANNPLKDYYDAVDDLFTRFPEQQPQKPQ